MANLSAADRSQISTEMTEATSPKTAEVLMQSVVDVPWDKLVTKDHLDARLAQVDARFAQSDARLERALRKQTIWFITAVVAVNGIFATWITAFH